ncbi:DcaP family trimeric outer membrane transporter [Dasania marina]|uniref:DcaP family trimeric outer membrane transporter n=1 Tax=Dasania marina TaxID=471499 RepID=UPI00037B077E|nr:DcaP family trimeric outer membrane transporter [Dasania marina]
MNTKQTSIKLLAAVAAMSSTQAFSALEIDLQNGDKISFGGYVKLDVRHVDGDVAYQDYWRGNNPGAIDTSHTGFNARETRFNTTYTHGDVTAFIEMDFYGGDGNEVATNSTNPRLRHAIIKYKNWIAGQYWTTFLPVNAFPEALDFAGAIVAESFVRQPQIRYTQGNFSVAVENPETWGDGTIDAPSTGGGLSGAAADSDETSPDLIASYKFKGDWGEVQVAGLLRQLDEGDAGIDETAFAANVGGRIKVGQEDDIRFQINVGESGRYVGAGMVTDIVIDPETGKVEVEETTAYTVAYRHIWNSEWRSTAYYGYAETDVLEYERSHWGVNLIKQLTPSLSVGVELGNFEVDDNSASEAIDSNYLQLSWKFTI